MLGEDLVVHMTQVNIGAVQCKRFSCQSVTHSLRAMLRLTTAACVERTSRGSRTSSVAPNTYLASSIPSRRVYYRMTFYKIHISTTPDPIPPHPCQPVLSIKIIILRFKRLAFLPVHLPSDRLPLLPLQIRRRDKRKANDKQHISGVSILHDVTKSVRTSLSVDAENESAAKK